MEYASNTASEIVEHIISTQRVWAEDELLALNPGGKSLKGQFAGLQRGELYPETLAELKAGAGGELSRINSLRSSTCLAINVFEPFRYMPESLGPVFGELAQSLSFEKKEPTGLQGESPHLDVVLQGKPSVGIECKFLEIYSAADNGFRDSYFETAGLWDNLPGLEDYARRISSGQEHYDYLAAHQLVKHALGLSKNHPEGFRLALVWYRAPGAVAAQIEAEIGRFTRAVSDSLDFMSITYQELVQDIARRGREPLDGYFKYLDRRYGLQSEVGAAGKNLPLIDLAGTVPTSRRGLAKAVSHLDVNEVLTSYYRTVATAPLRPLRGDPYFVGHDGAGGSSKGSREKLTAKAIFNRRSPLSIEGRSVEVLDYEFPLRRTQRDEKVGEIDLLGLEVSSGTLWIIELKKHPTNETPLSAFLQVLRYSAIVDANRLAIASETKAIKGLKVKWPPVVVVAADRPYWDRLHRSRATGDWRAQFQRLSHEVTDEFGFEILLLDLGDVEYEIVDGRAHLKTTLEISTL